jgi:hypothetical protein
LTGAPLKNVGALLRKFGSRGSMIPEPGWRFPWVAQGGFAGEGVVAPEHQLEKFAGMKTCPTYNFNGDPKSALLALDSPLISSRRLVSKNVCHGVVYDQKMHQHVLGVENPHLGLQLIQRGMTDYLQRKPAGKKFHDPLAACCALDPDIGTWAEVEVFREKGKWGSRLSPGSGTWIITGYNHDHFLSVLTET